VTRASRVARGARAHRRRRSGARCT
jgi:hypothetical protein